MDTRSTTTTQPPKRARLHCIIRKKQTGPQLLFPDSPGVDPLFANMELGATLPRRSTSIPFRLLPLCFGLFISCGNTCTAAADMEHYIHWQQNLLHDLGDLARFASLC